jgi:hypothetical protein
VEATVNNMGNGKSNQAEINSEVDEAVANSVHNSNEIEPDCDPNETAEQRLERWRQFYSEKPVDWYFDKDDYEEYLDDLLFDRLYREVQYNVFETGPSKYRGQEHVRFFWDDVRRQLRDEESPVLEWPPTQEQRHCTEDFEGLFDPKRYSKAVLPTEETPTRERTAEGTDPDLLKLRELLMEKPRQKPGPGPAPAEHPRFRLAISR